MAAKKKGPVNPLAARERRAKIGAIIGAVLLLAVAAYEVPSVMKMMNQKPPPGANATDAGNRNPDGSIPLPNVAGTSAAAPAATGQLVDTDVPPASATDGLVAFTVFQTKNVFRPQVTVSAQSSSESSSSGASSGTSSASTPPAATKPAATAPTATTPAPPTPTAPTATTPAPVIPPTTTTPTATTATTTTPAPAAAPGVTISVNGKTSHVSADGAFPSDDPVFRLVGWTKTTAKIGIVGGSYTGGAPTLTIQLGHPVTLENTTDGKQYRLELVATS